MLLNKEEINIINIKDILKYSKEINEYNFIINKKLLYIKQNILILKKIISKFQEISINGLKYKNLYVYINKVLFDLKLDFIYTEYKIVIKWLWCNAKCPFCIDWKRKWNISNQILILNDIVKKIIDDNVSIKNIDLLWWEPCLIIDEIIKLTSILKNENINLTFSTNVSLLDYEKINKLIDSWLEIFTFSIDFPNIKHENWRKLDWVFNKILDFTKYIQNKWRKVQWNTVVWLHNLSEINWFLNLYKNIKPDFHNFINIENNYKNSNLKLELEKKSKILIKNLFNTEFSQHTNIILNWFNDIKIKNKICHVPLYKKSFIIKNNKVNISPCYIHKNIINFDKFIWNSINWKCLEICDSSYIKNFKLN